MVEEDKLKKTPQIDSKTIEEICTETWKDVYKFIYFKVQNRQEAEDITQEAYVKVLSDIQKNGTGIDKYTSFLKTVSLNILRDNWRKRKRRGKEVELDELNPMETAIKDGTEERAQRELIQNALDNLGEDQRKVVELRILEGYSARETAEIMGKKEATIRVIQYRALQNLAKVLEKDANI